MYIKNERKGSVFAQIEFTILCRVGVSSFVWGRNEMNLKHLSIAVLDTFLLEIYFSYPTNAVPAPLVSRFFCTVVLESRPLFFEIPELS